MEPVILICSDINMATLVSSELARIRQDELLPSALIHVQVERQVQSSIPEEIPILFHRTYDVEPFDIEILKKKIKQESKFKKGKGNINTARNRIICKEAYC